MFELLESGIPGCFEIQPKVFTDVRGRFVKVFHLETFLKLGLECNFAEEYYSISCRNVLRGLHFQLPPADHVKLVYCVHGEVCDVVLDLRVGSPTFLKTATFTLSADRGNFIYIPKGLAHGFCVTSDLATLVYKVSTVYSSELDSGILWNSIEMNWPTLDPIVSDRDKSFNALVNFKSPFKFQDHPVLLT